MKNIAIPLLLAGSAKAEAKKKAAMAADYAVPEPILIATTWTDKVCVDAGAKVSTALTAKNAALAALEAEEKLRPALVTAEKEAMDARLEAIEKVLEQDELIEADVKANNTAIVALLGLKDDLDKANVAAALGSIAKANALSAETGAKSTWEQAVITYEGETVAQVTDANGVVTQAAINTTGLKGVWTTLEGQVTTAEGIRDKVSETTTPTTLADWTLVGTNYFRNGSIAAMNEMQNTLAAEDCDGGAGGTTGGTAGTTTVSGTVTTDAYGVDSNALWTACSAAGNAQTQGLNDDLAALGSISATNIAPSNPTTGKRYLLNQAADAEAAAFLLYAEYRLLARWLGWARARAQTNVNFAYTGTADNTTQSTTECFGKTAGQATDTFDITNCTVSYARAMRYPFNFDPVNYAKYNGGLDSQDTTATTATNIRGMTAAELHGAFATNATTANFNNEFHGKHAANLSASSPYPVYKLWLQNLRKVYGKATSANFDGVEGGTKTRQNSAERNMTDTAITTGATTATTLANNGTGTGTNVWGANPWVVASRNFVVKANDFIKAMDQDVETFTAQGGSAKNGYVGAFTEMKGTTDTSHVNMCKANHASTNDGTQMQGIISTTINLTGANYKNAAYTGNLTLGWSSASVTNPYTIDDAGGKAEGNTVCAHTCVTKYLGAMAASEYAGGAWMMTKTDGDRGTGTNYGKSYFVPKGLTAQAVAGNVTVANVLGTGNTTGNFLTGGSATTDYCTGFTWDGSSTDGTAACKIVSGVLPEAIDANVTTSGCFKRNLSQAAKTFGDMLNSTNSPTNADIPRVTTTASTFTYTAATVAGTIGIFGTETVTGTGDAQTKSYATATANNSFDFFQFTLEQWSGAYANLIDAEATFKVADWYFQKLSLMYGYDSSEYGALADGNYTKYGNIYESNINISYILGPKNSSGLTLRNPSLSNITLLELTGSATLNNYRSCYKQTTSAVPTAAIITSATWSAASGATCTTDRPDVDFLTQYDYQAAYTLADAASEGTAATATVKYSYGYLEAFSDAENSYNTAFDNFTAASETYDDRLIAIAVADANWRLARAQWKANNKAIERLQTLVGIAFTDKDDANTNVTNTKLAYTNAESAYTTASENMTRTAAVAATSSSLNTGFTVLETAAEEAWEAKETAVYGAVSSTLPSGGSNVALGVYAAGSAGSGKLGELKTRRDTAATKYGELVTASGDLDTLDSQIASQQATYNDKVAKHLAEEVLCKVENYNLYKDALDTAVGERATKLKDILALVTKAEEDAPAAGTAGARCEKALSNGTFRPARGETTCNEGLCCGAARIPDANSSTNVTMTIETCQAVGTTTYDYVPPRAPMATTAPAAVSYDFVCIEGAKKLAAAASALATAVYMLA